MKTGDSAPDFELADAHGKSVRLSTLWQKGPVVLYFYPKDETSICTKEACAFRDAYEDFVKAGAEVVGVSADDPKSHQGFAAHHRLPFILLSDPDAKARKLYGISSTLGLIPGRVTFVIDRPGIIRHVFSSQFRAEKHVQEALKVLESFR